MQLLDLHAKGTKVTAGAVQRPVAGVRPRRVRPAVKLAVNAVWSSGSHAPPPQQRQQHMPPLQQRTPAPSNGGTALQPAGSQSVLSAVGPAVKTARVRFWLKFHVDYGQSIRVIGGAQPLGAWSLARAAPMAWSNGDLWNVTLDLVPGQVYEYKYVIVDHSGVNAVDWQRGSNNVLALQAGDSEIEVYDNWRNQPGAMVVVDGTETTREKKLLSWAGELSAQRAELRQYKADLAMAREQTRMLRAEVGVMQSELHEAQAEKQQAEQRAATAEANAAALRLQLASTQARQRSTMEEAARLLSALDSSPEPPSLSLPPPGNGASKAREAPAYAGTSTSGGSNSAGASSSSNTGGSSTGSSGGTSSGNTSSSCSSSGSRGFGGFFGGFTGRSGAGGPTASNSGAAVAAAAAIAAAASGSGPASASGMSQ